MADELTNRMVIPPAQDVKKTTQKITDGSEGTVRMVVDPAQKDLLTEEDKQGIEALVDHGRMERSVVADKAYDFLDSIEKNYSPVGKAYFLNLLERLYKIKIEDA